jgi:hypothetical protein
LSDIRVGGNEPFDNGIKPTKPGYPGGARAQNRRGDTLLLGGSGCQTGTMGNVRQGEITRGVLRSEETHSVCTDARPSSVADLALHGGKQGPPHEGVMHVEDVGSTDGADHHGRRQGVVGSIDLRCGHLSESHDCCLDDLERLGVTRIDDKGCSYLPGRKKLGAPQANGTESVDYLGVVHNYHIQSTLVV